MNDAYWLAKDWANKTGWRVPDKQAKIIFRYWVWFQDHRRRDASNIVKVLADSLQGALYEDDKMLIVQNMDFAVDKTNPRVEVELEVVAREERAK